MMAMIARPIIIGAKYAVALGKIGRLNRRNPYVPIFRSTAARITEPAVGASTWASGNQVWNGNIGTLMANPTKNARKIQNCRVSGRYGPMAWKARISNVGKVPNWLAISGCAAAIAG